MLSIILAVIIFIIQVILAFISIALPMSFNGIKESNNKVKGIRINRVGDNNYDKLKGSTVDTFANITKKVGLGAFKSIKRTIKLFQIISIIVNIIVICITFTILGGLMTIPATIGGSIIYLIEDGVLQTGVDYKHAEKTEEVEEEVVSGLGKNNNDYYVYKQGGIKNVIAGGTTISGGGCGWCSLTCAMENLYPEKNGGVTPVGWLDIMPNTTKRHWASGGMGWSAPQQWCKDISAMGDRGKYTVIEQGGSGGKSSTAALDAIRKYAGDKDKAVILSTGNNTNTCLFTNGGHIICCISYNSSDDTFTILDSASGSLCAPGKLNVPWEELKNYKFPASTDSINGYTYQMKQYWVIQRTE